MKADAVVIGAGLAGLAAAVRLADAGLAVVVADRAPRAGGRATTFTDHLSGDRVDNGQHVLFGCYRETYAFLRRLGTADLAPLSRALELTMAGPDGRARVLKCPPWPPPWHLAAGVLRWPALSVADRLRVLRLVPLLREARRSGPTAVAGLVPPGLTAAAWLAAKGQSDRLNEWLWHPLVFAALNQPPHRAAARPFVRVVAELFGPRAEDSAIGLPRVPLDELYVTPAIRVIEARGGAVRLRTAARVVASAGGVVQVRLGADPVDTRHVVCAVPWHALESVWDGAVPGALTGVVRRAAATPASPIVTVNLWFDGPVLPAPFVGLIGGHMHWAFDRRAIVGDSAGHVSLVASGATDVVSLDNAGATAMALGDLRQVLPAARDRRVLRSVVVRESRATFSLAPGVPARPSPVTDLPGFYLAGDWVDTGLPGTLESAAASAHAAADALLGRRPAGLP